MGNLAIASVVWPTEPIRQYCVAAPADFPPNVGNAIIAIPTWIPFIVIITKMVTGVFLSEFYLTLVGLAVLFDQWIVNKPLQNVFDEISPFPGCSGEYGMPNAIVETLSLLYVVIYTYPMFYRTRRRLSMWKLFLLVGAWFWTCTSLIEVGYASAAQVFAGALTGAIVGICFQIFTFFVLFPAFAVVDGAAETWWRMHGLPRWIGWPIAYVLSKLGMRNTWCAYNDFWACIYGMRYPLIPLPVIDETVSDELREQYVGLFDNVYWPIIRKHVDSYQDDETTLPRTALYVTVYNEIMAAKPSDPITFVLQGKAGLDLRRDQKMVMPPTPSASRAEVAGPLKFRGLALK